PSRRRAACEPSRKGPRCRHAHFTRDREHARITGPEPLRAVENPREHRGVEPRALRDDVGPHRGELDRREEIRGNANRVRFALRRPPPPGGGRRPKKAKTPSTPVITSATSPCGVPRARQSGMTTAIVVEPPATPNPCSDEPSGWPDGRHHPLAAVLGQQAFAPLAVELTGRGRRPSRPGRTRRGRITPTNVVAPTGFEPVFWSRSRFCWQHRMLLGSTQCGLQA